MTGAVFSPDGTRIVTSSNDGTARVWDVASGHAVTLPLQHQNLVLRAAFNPDGARIVTTSLEAIRIWDATTGKLLAGPLQDPALATGAEFSPDGLRLLTIWGSFARIFDVPLAPGTLADWSVTSERASRYTLVNGILSPHHAVQSRGRLGVP